MSPASSPHLPPTCSTTTYIILDLTSHVNHSCRFEAPCMLELLWTTFHLCPSLEGDQIDPCMSSPPQQLVFPLRPCHSSHAFLLSNCLSHHSQISPQSSQLVHPESKKGGRRLNLSVGMAVGEEANDFDSRTSQLTVTLRSTHFTTGGQATLTCEATVPGVYRRCVPHANMLLIP